MTFEYVERELQAFLDSKTPLIMAVKGKWGAGKTYLVTKVLQKTHDDYAYVSLFGINTIEDLQEAIFVQLISNRTSKDSSKNWRDVTKGIFENTGSLGKWAKTGMKVWMAQDFERTTIVVDDLERRGDNLRLQDVLGYCFNLKEQEKWKVIFVLNEAQLKAEDKDVLNSFREKVIDTEIELAPTVEEIILKGFKQKIPEAVTTLRKLNVDNIRAVQKIEMLLRKLEPKMSGFDSEIRGQIINSATVLGWYYFSRTQKTIPWEFIKSFKSSSFAMRRGRFVLSSQKNPTEVEKEQQKREDEYTALLNSCGYHDTGPLEMILIEVLEKGILSPERFGEVIASLSERVESAKARNEYSQAWEAYRSTFEDNSEEFSNMLVKCFERYVSHYSPQELGGAVTILRQLGYAQEAKKVSDIFFNCHEIFPPSYSSTSLLLEDLPPDIKKEVEKRANQPLLKRKPIEVFDNILHQSSFNPFELDILEGLDEDEWYDLFKNQLRGNPELYFYVRKIKEFRKYNVEPYQSIFAAAKKALDKIAAESTKSRTMVETWFQD